MNASRASGSGEVALYLSLVPWLAQMCALTGSGWGSFLGVLAGPLTIFSVPLALGLAAHGLVRTRQKIVSGIAMAVALAAGIAFIAVPALR